MITWFTALRLQMDLFCGFIYLEDSDLWSTGSPIKLEFAVRISYWGISVILLSQYIVQWKIMTNTDSMDET